MPKIFIFVSQTNIALIIVKKKDSYQLIKWDITTDTFTEGQWLHHKKLAINCCAISPDGKYFGWVYNIYGKLFSTHAGISLIPNFSADLYSGMMCGCWDCILFDNSSNPLNLEKYQFQYKCKHTIPCIFREGSYEYIAESGLAIYNSTDRFLYSDNKLITVDEYKVLVNNIVVYDATDNVFIEKKAI
jgi:hypothetical protein